MKLTKSQKDIIGKFLLETYRFNFGGLVIGFIVAPEKIHLWVFIVGLIFSFLCFAGAVLLAKEE